MSPFNHRLTRLHTAALAALMGAAAPAAWAQNNTDAQAEAQRVQVTGRAVGPDVGNSALRVPLPLDKTPQSVVVLESALLDQQGVRTFTEALGNVSAVRSTDARDRYNFGPRIRGFAAGVLVDGVALPGTYSTPDSLVGVQRIEVLKGPSGTLYGGSQSVGNGGFMGGLIALSTAVPDNTPSGHATLRLGNVGQAGLALGLNRPLTPELAVRVDAEAARDGSETDSVKEKRHALQFGLSWRPAADRELVLRLRHHDSGAPDYAGLPRKGTLDAAAYAVPRSRFLSASGLPDTEGRTDLLNLQWSQRLDAAWSWRLGLAQVRTQVDQRGVFALDSTTFAFPASANDGPFYALAGARLWNRMRSTLLTTNLTGRLDAFGARHTVVAGLDIDRTRDDAFLRFSPGGGLLGFVDITNPVAPAWAEPDTTGAPDQRNRYRSTAAYVQDHADFGALQLMGSLRHSRAKVVDVNPNVGVNNQSAHSKTLGRVGAAWAFTPQWSAFAGWGQGMRVPTFAIFSDAVKPELSTQSELGLRVTNLQGLNATLALFDLKLKNALVADAANPGQTLQAGQASSKGVDLDLRWQVNPAWHWLASASRLQAKLDDTGKRLVDVPRGSARLYTHYELGAGSALPGLGLGLGLKYHSALPGDGANSYFTPAATLWDAQLAYKLQNVVLRLAVNNLADKRYWVPSRYFGGGQVTPAPRRSVHASASIDF